MAPVFQAAGAQQNSTGASVNVAWPTHLTNDIGLVVIETSGNSATLTPPAGWAAVPGTPVTDVATIAGSKLHVWWKRATSSAEAAVATGAATDHIVARLYTFRGCVTTGNPWNVTTTGVKTTASTTATVPALTTTLDDTLITMIVGRPDDSSSTTHFGVPVNAGLTGLAEAGEAGTVNGNGGGFVVSYGIESTPGSTGTSTLTKAASTTDTYVALALKAPTELIHTVGTFALAGTTTGLLQSVILAGTTQNFSLVGNNTDLSKFVSLDVTAGGFNLNQSPVVLQQALRIDATTRTYSLVGTTAALAFNRQLIGQTGTFTIAGVPVELTYTPVIGATYTLDNQTGSFAIAGIFSNINKQSLLNTTVSSYVVTGVQSGLIASRRLDVVTGSVVLAGQLVALNRQVSLSVTNGSFSVAGVSADFNRQYQLNTQRGVFSFDGLNIGQVGQRLLNTNTGSFVSSDVPLELRRFFPLLGTTGSFVVGSDPIQYFATRTLNAQPATYVLYAQDGGSNLFRYVPPTPPQQQIRYDLKSNQWVLGRFSTLGGSYRI